MKTWLFIWNPNNYKWDDKTYGYNELRNDISQLGYAYGKWSSGINKSIRKGDRVFLIRLGTKDRGIVASGYAETMVFEGTHWDEKRAETGKKARRIYIRFDKILNIDAGEYLPYEKLQYIDHHYHWSPQGSGVSIPDDTVSRLEIHWKTYRSY